MSFGSGDTGDVGDSSGIDFSGLRENREFKIFKESRIYNTSLAKLTTVNRNSTEK